MTDARRWLCCGAVLLGGMLAATELAHADMVKCRQPNGSLYVGTAPPEGCAPVGSGQGAVSRGSSRRPGEFLPTPTSAPSAEEQAKQHEIERRQGTAALAIQRTEIKQYRSGRFFEGMIVNGADFPVYGAQVCIEYGRRCQSIAPSTLQPGATGTFSFEVLGSEMPDYRITWEQMRR